MSARHRADRPEQSFGYVPPAPRIDGRKFVRFWFFRIGAALLVLGGGILIAEANTVDGWELGRVAFGIASGIAGAAVWFAAADIVVPIDAPSVPPEPPPTALAVRGRIGIPFFVAAAALALLDAGVAFVVISAAFLPVEVGSPGMVVMAAGFAAVVTAFFGPIPIAMWKSAGRVIWWIDESGVGIGGASEPIPIERLASITHTTINAEAIIVEHHWVIRLDDRTLIEVVCPVGSTPRPRRIRRTVARILQ
ncbi:hypothetical protein [Tsukamurella pseudospumae]|uniref:hypothetical protein n=1 Tax=Tsukamurella pseudospumae TaxID=239498 RepID=UPI000B170149|nr:hypothetical protein [Tsukamurella pseudospumae]